MNSVIHQTEFCQVKKFKTGRHELRIKSSFCKKWSFEAGSRQQILMKIASMKRYSPIGGKWDTILSEAQQAIDQAYFSSPKAKAEARAFYGLEEAI